MLESLNSIQPDVSAVRSDQNLRILRGSITCALESIALMLNLLKSVGIW